MKKMVLSCSLLAFALANGWAEDSSAQGMFYKMAKKTSSQMVVSAWGSLGRDCHKADQLMQIIGDAVDRTARDIKSGKYHGKSAVEFGNGYIAGLVGTLDDIVNQCSNECSMIGKASGEWSAEIFCAVSQIIGGPAQFFGLEDFPNLICGEAYRTSCESKFVGHAKGLCSAYANGPVFDAYYPASRQGCCSYSIKP